MRCRRAWSRACRAGRQSSGPSARSPRTEDLPHQQPARADDLEEALRPVDRLLPGCHLDQGPAPMAMGTPALAAHVDVAECRSQPAWETRRRVSQQARLSSDAGAPRSCRRPSPGSSRSRDRIGVRRGVRSSSVQRQGVAAGAGRGEATEVGHASRRRLPRPPNPCRKSLGHVQRIAVAPCVPSSCPREITSQP